MAAKTLDFVQIGEGGEGEVVWTKSKRAAAFFRENIPEFVISKISTNRPKQKIL